jgi:hypothetical protein
MVDARARLRIGAFLGLLALLFVHQRFQLLPAVGLAGEEQQPALAPLALRSWWNGKLQASFERWLPARLRLRGWLVRLDNQVGMTLFRQPPESGTLMVLGREGTLFEKAYVDEYNRPRRITTRGVEKVLGSLERLDALLRSRGSRLLVVVAPGKPEVYPELLPPRHVAPGRERRRSRYQVLAPALRRSAVTLVDAVAVLRRERERGTPVFARGGTHFNHYANGVLAARLLAELEREAPGRFVQLRVSGSRTDGAVWGADDDLGSLLNVFWPRPWPGPQTHPVLERTDAGRRPPRLLFTGDSFSLQFLTFMAEEGLMEPGESLYYFNRRVRHPGGGTRPFDRKAFDPAREFAGMDAVVLVTSDLNIGELGFGFVEAAIRGLEQL